MKYDYLTPDERLSMLRPRLAGLERDHFNLTLDRQITGGTDDPRIEAIESSLEALRKEAADLEKQAKARTAKS